jgi:hypothetical protein
MTYYKYNGIYDFILLSVVLLYLIMGQVFLNFRPVNRLMILKMLMIY